MNFKNDFKKRIIYVTTRNVYDSCDLNSLSTFFIEQTINSKLKPKKVSLKTEECLLYIDTP